MSMRAMNSPCLAVESQNSKEVGVAGFMVSRVPMGMARDSPVDETAVSEQSEECEGTTWLLKS